MDNSDGTLTIVSTSGNPPYQYVIEYRCKGIERLEGNDPVFRNNHQVEITLGNNYPKEQPTAKFLTPIFHPNVYRSMKICQGQYWVIGEPLFEVVMRIGKVIQYEDDIINLQSPANNEAKKWAEKNMWRFPVDNQTFKSQISWDEQPVQPVNIYFQDI